MKKADVIILYGGISDEREISLISGRNVAEALSTDFNVELVDLQTEALPEDILKGNKLVFPVLHGGFGEDGRLQNLLEEEDIQFVGSGAAASALCMNKMKSKEVMAEAGLPILPGYVFSSSCIPSIDKIITDLGSDLVLKPNDKGSSFGLYMIKGAEQLEKVLENVDSQEWMLEQRVTHKEFTIGVLEGKGLGIVEICPKKGAPNDYEHKYTAGTVDYHFPAPLDKELEQKIRYYAEVAYDACGCRDFSRIDMVMDEAKNLYILEINTLPGLTPNSTINRSAICCGYDYRQLCSALIKPGIERQKQTNEILISDEG